MMVLRRKVGDIVHVGDDVKITVISITPGRLGAPSQVKLGFEAPTTILIDRDEVRRRRLAGSELSPPLNAEALPPGPMETNDAEGHKTSPGA